MRKPLFQGLVMVALFFSAWFILQRVDWVALFRMERAADGTEQKLGDLFWEYFSFTEREIADPIVTSSIDSIVTRICRANGISRESVQVHVLDRSEVNAFALPGGRIVLLRGLILAAESPEELSGVMAHEIAHVQLDHVMQKLIRELGLSVLFSMAGGGGGSEAIRETARLLSSTAFDRELEREADTQAIDYLANANIDPEPFAHFLYRLADSQGEAMRYLSWVSTHPDPKERAQHIIAHSKGRVARPEPVLSEAAWESLQEALSQ